MFLDIEWRKTLQMLCRLYQKYFFLNYWPLVIIWNLRHNNRSRRFFKAFPTSTSNARQVFFPCFNSVKPSKWDNNLLFKLVGWILSAACPPNPISLFWYIFLNFVSLNTASTVLAAYSINETSSASRLNVSHYHCNLCLNVADLICYKEQLNTLHDTLHTMPSYRLY